MTTYSPDTSDEEEDFRLIWNGKVFKLLEPGDSGEGLLVSFDGKDNAVHTFPTDYSPVGPN